MKRRSLKQLQRAIQTAPNKREKAIAFYELGVFHDNNSREMLAIPNYRNAIRLGLGYKQEVTARAWLASSLFKINRTNSALKEISIAKELSKDKKLRKFLAGLEEQIWRAKKSAN